MKISILTLFQTFFDSPTSMGVIDAAIKNKKIYLDIINLREYGAGNYKKCDDYSYGGGPGLVMTCSIFQKYFDKNKRGHTILFSPTGNKLTQKKVKEISKKEHITLILGHYEGVDARVESLYVDETISIGDYVLSGGEIPALVLIDAISRYKDILGNDTSVINDTFEDNTNGLLEYEQYTRPNKIEDLEVPPVLLSGHHKNIEQYRRERSIIKTYKYRPDMLSNVHLTKSDILTIYEHLIDKTNYKQTK